MGHRFQHSLLATLSVLGGTLFMAGCGCDADATCLPPPTGGASGEAGAGGEGGAGGGPDCPGDPTDGEVLEGCGVWASSSMGDDANAGTRDFPVKTLSKALELAAQDGGPMRVYACGEVFSEAVEIKGISLFGGFDCTNGWTYAGTMKRAEIRAPVALAAMKLLASDRFAELGDLRVIASDAVDPGASSIAVFALQGSRARFRRVEVIAGKGADGADGEPGHHSGHPAQKGLAGINGADACTMAAGLGGAGVLTVCEDGSESLSGQGGDGGAAGANDGLNGFPWPAMNPQGKGAGGKGEDAVTGESCTPGYSGAHGADGQDGFGAMGRGVLSEAGYFGARGGDGTPGLPGQGGGGGGASLGANCLPAPFGGAGGGSGGSGGCGGKGGQGGQAGGSSIGFALLSDDIYFQDGRIVSVDAGNGGNGGALQPGGQGGLPGYGGLGSGAAAGAKSGCAGGVGGKGGNGGNGGGGQGGHSVTVLHPLGVELFTMKPIERVYGKEGKGGVGGDVDSFPQKGADGYSGIYVTVKLGE